MPDERERMFQRLFEQKQEDSSSDHDLLVKLGEAVKALASITADHENRIRNLERLIMYGSGAVGALKLVWDFIHK